MSEHARNAVISRRNVLIGSGLVIAVVLGGRKVLMSPHEAHKAGAETTVLTPQEAQILGHLGEALVPGALAAGIVPFVDSQLAADPNESLLIARYFGIAPPYEAFYRSGLRALEELARAELDTGFVAVPVEQVRELALRLLNGSSKAWQGPPAPLFYLCLRSDAVDVVFGTPAGFETLGIPYREHIMPPGKW
jgi:hypothetical protein